MATTWDRRRKRRLLLTIGIIAGLILLVPYPIPHMPATSLEVVDEDGNSVYRGLGSLVYHTSMAYSGWHTFSLDQHGKASIPRQSYGENLDAEILVAATAGPARFWLDSFREASVDIFIPDSHALNPTASGLGAELTIAA